MSTASEMFDEHLFTIKLYELPPPPRIDGSFFPTNAAIVSYPVSLLERLERIDRICREVWQIQGKTVTPEFVREVLVPKVITQIDAVVGETVTRSNATDLERWGPAWAYLAREVGELRSEFANRYAREIEGLALAKQAESSLAQNNGKTAQGVESKSTDAASGPPPEGLKGKPSEGFSHSPDYRTVSVRSGTYTLTSEQAAMIQILHEAHENGNPDISIAHILERLEKKTSRWQDTFRSNPKAKQALIKSTRKGTLRLNL